MVEATARVAKVGSYFIQFITFTYIQVIATFLCPKNIPCYPLDKLILVEISMQSDSTYDRVWNQHKITWGWVITIGAFEVEQKKEIAIFEVEWDEYPLDDYPLDHPILTTLEWFKTL